MRGKFVAYYRVSTDKQGRPGLGRASTTGKVVGVACDHEHGPDFKNDHGKRQTARDLLAPAYGWFTEGLNTLDLKEANALLDTLAQ